MRNRRLNSRTAAVSSARVGRSRTKPRQRTRSGRRAGKTVARPLESLAFLLPLLLIYEVGAFVLFPSGAFQRDDRVVAFHLLRWLLATLGSTAVWMPAVGIVLILLCIHAVSRRPWRIDGRAALWMLPESIALALPLLLVSRFVRLSAAAPAVPAGESLAAEVVLGIGAGIYEELVFRLILISLLMIVASDLLRLPAGPIAVFAVMLSAVLFASHHHPPLGTEPFAIGRFLFRFLAGAYLGAVFHYRGYGPAAGAHAAYNVMATLIHSAHSSPWPT